MTTEAQTSPPEESGSVQTSSPPSVEVEASEASSQTRDEQGRFRPKGIPDDERWEHIELSPEAQKRFNRVYGALKHHQALGEQLLNDNLVLAKRLEALEQNVYTMGRESTESDLTRAKADALAAGNYKAVVEIDNQLMEMKVKALQPKVPEALMPAVDAGAVNYQLDDASKRVLDEWGSERSANGDLLRPWVDPRHPLHEKANRAHQLAMADPMTAFADIGTVLDTIDRYMGVEKPNGQTRPSAAAKPARHAAFMGSDTPPKSKSALPQLSAQQIHIAKKMYRGDPNAVERYRRAIASYAKS